MKHAILAVTILSVCTLAAPAQTGRRSFVRTMGTASVPVRPDQARIDVAVTTQASAAQDATTQNATQVDQVLSALRQLLGAQADIKTISYTVSPVYRYPQGGTPQLTGWQVVNTMEVTIDNTQNAGKVIDAAVQAGATNIQRLLFTLKDDTSVRAQALKLATQQAKARADAIASGLGLHIGSVIAVEESGASVIQPLLSTTGAGAATPTPIESGTLTVTATVTLEVELVN